MVGILGRRVHIGGKTAVFVHFEIARSHEKRGAEFGEEAYVSRRRSVNNEY